MILANPIALLWGLLAVPVVLLYMRRLRARIATVAAGTIWHQVLAEESTRSAWQPFRHRVSLAVQLAALGLLVLAAADPQMTPRRLVIIVDNSAAMNLSHESATRLDEARQAAKRLIADIGPRDSVGVVSVAKAAAVRCNLTNERATLDEAIDTIPSGSGTAHVAAAVELARRMLGEDTPGRIVVLSSCSFPDAAELDKAEDVELLRLGKSTSNAAITRLNARREPVEGLPCQVLVEVANFSDKQAERKLSLLLDDKPLQKTSLKVPADGRRQHVFQIGTVESGTLTARIEPGDSYPADDEASLSLPMMGETSRVIVLMDSSASMDISDAEVGSRAERAERIMAELKDFVKIDPLGNILISDGEDASVEQPTELALPVYTMQDGDDEQDDANDDQNDRFADNSAFLQQLAESAGGYLSDETSTDDLVSRLRQMLGVDSLADGAPVSPPAVITGTTNLGGQRLATAANDFRVPELGAEASAIKAQRRGAAPWVYLAVLAIVLLAAEWCLYQRRWLS